MVSTKQQQAADGFVEGQRSEWNSTAAGWEKWWPWMEEESRKVDRRFLELAGVGSGDTVLDLATGLGEPAYSAAAIVGEGQVIGVDISPEMLSLARERAKRGALPNVEYIEADARSLPFKDASFDVVTCKAGLMLMPEPERVLAEVKRVLRPGGQCAMVVPGSPQETPMIGVAFGVIRNTLSLAPPPAGTPNFYSLSKPGSVEALYERAGLSHVASERVIWATPYESAAKYVEFLVDVAAQVTRLIRNQPGNVQERIWKQIEGAASQMAGADGSILMDNVMVCVVGRN